MDAGRVPGIRREANMLNIIVIQNDMAVGKYAPLLHMEKSSPTCLIQGLPDDQPPED